MIERGTRPCRLHRGEPEHNCGCCRSEAIADPAAEPERLPPANPAAAIPFLRKEAS